MRVPKRLLESLAQVESGADVLSYALAKDLREIEKRFPKLITIGPLRMYRGDGTGCVPYFGAIATAEGRKELRKIR